MSGERRAGAGLGPTSAMAGAGLTSAMAGRIADLVHGATGRNVNVMGEGGRILASSDPKRVGTVHEGARTIMAGELDEIAISPEMAATMAGVKPGYNGAVFFEGVRVACIGVSGDPELVKPFQKMAAVVLRQEFERLALSERERRLSAEVRDQIGDIAERMLVLSLNGAVIAARLGEAGKGFKIVVSEMRGLASQIGERVEELKERSASGAG